MSGLGTIEAAISAIAAGRPLVVVDDEDRENEGDLVMAAEHMSPEWMGFFVRHSSGVVCAPITAERAEALRLPPMVSANEDPKGTAYTVSCDAAAGVTTGISAADRAHTVRLLADPAATSADFTRPGHVFPLIAHPGGVRTRPGHTEAGIEFARLAGCAPASVIAELVDDDGSMMRMPALRRFARAHGLVLVSIADLTAHLERSLPECTASPTVTLPTPAGPLEATAYTVEGTDHLVLSYHGEHPDIGPPLVRLHSECLTGDVLGSHRCDCGEQLSAALSRIRSRGGHIVYLRGHEGRGIGLAAKIAAYALQDAGFDTVDANTALGYAPDGRDYRAAAAILRALGIEELVLMTNNPAKLTALADLGFAVSREPLEAPPRPENAAYLATKRTRMHHTLTDRSI